jgi:hypothetical protein
MAGFAAARRDRADMSSKDADFTENRTSGVKIERTIRTIDMHRRTKADRQETMLARRGTISFVILGELLPPYNFHKLTELVSFPDTPRGARFRGPVPMYRCSPCRSMLAFLEETERIRNEITFSELAILDALFSQCQND